MSAANGSSIASGSMEYTLSAPTRFGSKIIAGTQPIVQIALRGDRLNADTGKGCGLLIYKADIRPSGGLNFIGNDYISMTFKGTLIKP